MNSLFKRWIGNAFFLVGTLPTFLMILALGLVIVICFVPLFATIFLTLPFIILGALIHPEFSIEYGNLDLNDLKIECEPVEENNLLQFPEKEHNEWYRDDED